LRLLDLGPFLLPLRLLSSLPGLFAWLLNLRPLLLSLGLRDPFLRLLPGFLDPLPGLLPGLLNLGFPLLLLPLLLVQLNLRPLLILQLPLLP
jgi:hypothetical protein